MTTEEEALLYCPLHKIETVLVGCWNTPFVDSPEFPNTPPDCGKPIVQPFGSGSAFDDPHVISAPYVPEASIIVPV